MAFQSFARLLLVLVLALCCASADNICDKCICTDIKAPGKVVTMRIDCVTGTIQEVFQSANSWPYQLKQNSTPPTLIDVSFNYNIMVELHPLPAVPIVRFSSTNNHIVAIHDEAFMGPSETLEEIDLSSNRLTSSLQPNAFKGPYSPRSLQPLPKVRVLSLKRNAIHSLHPDLFEHLPALEELYLDQNPLRVIDTVTVKAIATIINLKVLSLSHTGLKTLPDTFLHTPRFLETLDISYNNLDSVPATIGDARELKTLILDGNPIRHFHNGSMPTLPKLSKLSISMMPYLTTIEDGAFAGLIGLQEFYCRLNPHLSVIETYAMGEELEFQQKNITKLFINNNALTHLTRHMVLYWSRLEKVALHGNPWTCDCLNQWMVTDLVPILDGIDPSISKAMWCHQPPELQGKSMFDVQMHSPHMRCLDLYGNRPENDSSMLIGALIGSVLAIPITLSLVQIWKKRARIISVLCPCSAVPYNAGGGAAEYSRAFYKRADVSTASGEF